MHACPVVVEGVPVTSSQCGCGKSTHTQNMKKPGRCEVVGAAVDQLTLELPEELSQLQLSRKGSNNAAASDRGLTVSVSETTTASCSELSVSSRSDDEMSPARPQMIKRMQSTSSGTYDVDDITASERELANVVVNKEKQQRKAKRQLSWADKDGGHVVTAEIEDKDWFEDMMRDESGRPTPMLRFMTQLTRGICVTLVRPGLFQKRKQAVLYTDDSGYSVCWVEVSGGDNKREPMKIPMQCFYGMRECGKGDAQSTTPAAILTKSKLSVQRSSSSDLMKEWGGMGGKNSSNSDLGGGGGGDIAVMSDAATDDDTGSTATTADATDVEEDEADGDGGGGEEGGACVVAAVDKCVGGQCGKEAVDPTTASWCKLKWRMGYKFPKRKVIIESDSDLHILEHLTTLWRFHVGEGEDVGSIQRSPSFS